MTYQRSEVVPSNIRIHSPIASHQMTNGLLEDLTQAKTTKGIFAATVGLVYQMDICFGIR